MKKLDIRSHTVSSAWLKFATLEFIYEIAIGIGNYQTVYLQSRGFTASFIGVINAAMAAITILITPVWGMLSDRMRSIRSVFLLTLIAGAATFAFIPAITAIPGLWTSLFLAYLCLVYMFRNPTSSLLDNWLVRYSKQNQLEYGSVRAFGSLGYAVSGIAIAGLVSAFGTEWTFPIGSIMMLPALFMSLRTDDSKPASAAQPQQKKESLNPAILFRNYYYTTFLIFSFLICLVVNSATAFLPYLLSDIGIASTRYGLLTGYIALIEIPMLMTSSKLRQSMPLYMITFLSCCCYSAGCLLLSTCARSLISVTLIETFNGLGSGLFIASASNYIYTLSPENLKATGQSIYVSVTAAAGIIASLAGGMLIDAFGATAFYFVIGGIAAFSALFLIFTIFFGQKKLKLPIKTC